MNRRAFVAGAAIAGATVAAGGLPGCAAGGGTQASSAKGNTFGRADNEIFTYVVPDPAKTQLVVAVVGAIEIAPIVELFESQNPNVQVITLDITGGNPKYRPYLEWVANGKSPHVMMLGNSTVPPSQYSTYFEDLTDRSYAGNYDTETILNLSANGRLFFLPGPRAGQGMVYNKTLFQQHSWQVPKNRDEFLTLCDTIAADTAGAVLPYNSNAKYENEFTCCLEGMTYPQTLGGASNRTWLHDFKAGKATFAGHMEPLFSAAKQLADHGVLKASDFTYSATTRLEEFKKGSIAVINYTFSDIPADGAYTFATMPFLGSTDQDAYVYMSSSYWTAIPKRDRTDAETAATEAFVELVSSPEGQDAYIGGRALIGTTANAKIPENEAFAGVRAAIDAGHVFSPEYFTLDDAAEADFSGSAQVRLAVQQMVNDGIAEAAAAKMVDDAAANARSNPSSEAAVGTASEDFTILETSNLFADVFRQKTGADAALVLDNVIYRGNVMRIFAGDITPSKVTYLKPRSFDNGAVLVCASMTGAQLRAALDDPMGKNETADCVYAVSGLKCTVAPWAAVGSKVRSVALADGSEIRDDRTYTVAFWDGTVKPDYYDAASVQKTTGTFEDLLTSYLKDAGAIAPSHDDRMSLVWE